MKVADWIITYLRDIGVRKVFVVYGAANGDLIDAFTRTEGIEYVATMHEQAGSFAAEVYAKATGKLGCAIATSGPGGINLLNGIANCFYDSVPCLFITGQINSKFLKPDNSVRQVGFQENDIVAMSKPITKMARMITSPKGINNVMKEAVYIATSGRPGPVLLDIPIDIQKREAELDTKEHEFYNPRYSIETIRNQIKSFLDDYEKAERPVLLIGGGVHWAKAQYHVRTLSRLLRIPSIPTWNAIDIITSDSPYYAGRVGTYGGDGRNFAIQNADLLLSIGCRFSGRITGGQILTFARRAKKYIVDIDKANLSPAYQQVKGDVNIYCDARLFAEMMLTEIDQRLTPIQQKESWLEKTQEWVRKYRTCLPEFYQEKDRVNPYVFIDVLSKELAANDIIVADCGGNVVNTYQSLYTRGAQRVISSHGNSPMGFSFAGAIGACLATDFNRVICLIGDGGFNMNIQELQTVINYKLPLKTFIMNNQIYGITRQFQDTHFGSRYEASGPKGYNPPNFIPIIKAYGIKTEHIKDHRELRGKIRKVLNYKGAIVCDVNMKHFCQYEPRIFGWKTPIEDMTPLLPRDEFRQNMLIEPVEGWENPEMPARKFEDA